MRQFLRVPTINVLSNQFFSNENFIFYAEKKSLYITWACFRNASPRGEQGIDMKMSRDFPFIMSPQCRVTAQGLHYMSI